MNTLNAKPNLLKQANLSNIRKIIKTKGSATRAEIVAATMISTTTVRSLLSEMLENGEIESIGHDKSSGGRKAERYTLKPDYYHCAAFCISDTLITAMLVNICGEIVERTCLESPKDDYLQIITDFLDELILHKEIKAIGLGVPGAVDGGKYWRMNEHQQLCSFDIGDSLSARYHVPVLLENDLNATAIGFGQCYIKEFPSIDPDNTNMAYLHFESNCISAGFITGGKVIRGSRNFAGELGLIPFDGDKPLYECIQESMDDVQYTDLIVKVISWICGILNPQYVALGGPTFRDSCIGPIGDCLFALLPSHMATEILYAPDVLQDFCNGVAYLTAGKMFDDVLFVKE